MVGITQAKGMTTELHCVLDLTAMGYRCLQPMDDSAEYDVVVDMEDGRFIRIQCKTASWANDTADPQAAFVIYTYRMTTNTHETVRRKYTENEVDYFYTWFQGQGYIVSIKEATGATFRWRYEYPPSGQRQGVHIAADYKIEEVWRNV